MKIFNNPNVSKAMKVYNKACSDPVKKTEGVSLPKDQLEISEKAKEFQIALQAFKALPEVREEKIQALREQIQQGKYNPSGKEIGDKMLEAIMIDRKI